MDGDVPDLTSRYTLATDSAVASARTIGRGVEHLGMLPAVVLGQYGTRLARPGCHSALANLAANDWKTGDGHGETAGI